MRKEHYYSGQGRLNISERTAHNNPTPTGFYFVGNVSELTLSMEVENIEHKESYTGNAHTDRVLEVGRDASFSFTVDNFIKENLEFAMFGESTTQSGTSVSDERHVAPAPGYHIYLKHINLDPSVTPTVKTDPDGTPTEMTAGTDYEIDGKSGRLTILTGGSIAEGDDLGVDYTFLDYNEVAAYSKKNTDKVLVFEGLNRSEDMAPVLVTIHKGRLQPLSEWALINDEFAELSIEGMAQWDENLDATSPAGQFWSVKQIG